MSKIPETVNIISLKKVEDKLVLPQNRSYEYKIRIKIDGKFYTGELELSE